MKVASAPSLVTDHAVGPPVDRALSLLRQSHDYAAELDRDAWDFSVEISVLREFGTTLSDLRWLVCKQYVDHAVEITAPGANGREFVRGGDLTFDERTCFVLTQAGIRFAERAQLIAPCSSITDERTGANGQDAGETPISRVSYPSAQASRAAGNTNGQAVADNGRRIDQLRSPEWDRYRHELRFGHALVKVFKLPSPNQEAILMAFEEEGWPPRIDDPLPLRRDLDRKQRLHDAIKGLNRNQKSRLIRFMGDGTGEGVRWEPRPAR